MAPLFGGSKTNCSIMLEGIMRNISVKNYIEFGPVDREEISFKGISYLELWWQFCSAEQTLFEHYW